MSALSMEHIKMNQAMESKSDSGNLISFLLQQGLGEATDVLLIDEALCVRCNNCEKACAETHDGTSRLNREAGHICADSRADLLSSLRTSALHERLPARRDSAFAER